MSNSALHCTVNWKFDAGRLQCSYTLTNVSAFEIAVFDVLFRTRRNGSRVIDPGFAFSRVSENGLMLIEKTVPELRDDLDVPAPVVPYARSLGSNERLTGIVDLEFPKDLYYPYQNKKSGVKVNNSGYVQFLFGYAAIDNALVSSLVDGPDGPTFMVRHSWAVQRHRVVASEISPLEIDLRQQR